MIRQFHRGFAAAVAAVMLLGATVFAAQDPVARQSQLDDEMAQINRHYDDVRRELNEEYAAINQEKDENCEAIFERVRDLKLRRAEAMRNLEAEQASFEETMRNGNIPAQDQRFIAAAQPISARREQVTMMYDSSLDTLQHLYQLNGKRFNDLMKIHNARESLEENRMRELRDFATRAARLNAMDARQNLTDDERVRLAAETGRLQDERNIAEDRYNTSIAALDEYRDLVNDRIAAQRAYVEDYQNIMNDLVNDTDPGQREETAVAIANLNTQKDADERVYQNNVRYIEERLAYERMRAREMARLASDRRDIDTAWARLQASYNRHMEDVRNQLSVANISEERRAELDRQIARDQQLMDQDRRSYEAAIANLDERQQLAERALSERQAYLNDRNNIRVRMSREPMTAENRDTYRNDISALEERRIEAERDIRANMMRLNNTMPADFQVSPYLKSDMKSRGERITQRYNKMKERLSSRWEAAEQNYNREIAAIDAQLQGEGVDAATRDQLNERKDSLQRRLAASKERVDKATRRIDERLEAEQKRINARANYLSRRAALQESLAESDGNYNDMASYEQQLRALDTELSKQEREYRNSIKPLGDVVTADADSDGWDSDRAEQVWNQQMQNISADVRATMANQTMPNQTLTETSARAAGMAATRTAPTAGIATGTAAATADAMAANNAARTNAVQAQRTTNAAINNQVGEPKSTWARMRESIVDSYRDAVNYLAD